MRSIWCTLMAWLAVYKPEFRKVCVVASSVCALGALGAADIATSKLRENSSESTTATMPYVSFPHYFCTPIFSIIAKPFYLRIPIHLVGWMFSRNPKKI